MLHKLRFVIVSALVILSSAGVSYAVSASRPNALLPAGTTRYATVFDGGFASISYNDGWVDMPGMVKYISIPTGQTADVIVIFCGTVGVNTASGWLNVRVLIRDALASPSQALLTHLDDSTSNCAIFEKSNVTAGSPAVKVQWEVDPSANSADVISRQMFVIVNTH